MGKSAGTGRAGALGGNSSGYIKPGPCGNNSMLVKLGFTKVSQLEQEVLLPDTGAQRALTHSPERGQARPQVGVDRACRQPTQAGSLKSPKAINIDHLPQSKQHQGRQGCGRRMSTGHKQSQRVLTTQVSKALNCLVM